MRLGNILAPHDSSDAHLITLDLGIGESRLCVGSESLVKVSQRNFVEVNVKLLLQLVQIFLLGLG